MPQARAHRLADLAQSSIRAMTRACNRVGGINLGQGICDLPTPERVRQAAIAAIERDDSSYTYAEGLAPLRERIAAKLARVNGIEADPEGEILVTSGSAAAFTCAIHGLLDPGDGLLVPEPYYGYHVGAALVAGLDVQTLRLEAPDFALTPAGLRAALRPNTRAVVLCTPANPSGRMYTRAELEGLALVAREHDLLIITDEIYEEIRYEGREHVSPATVADLAERTVTIMGLSKTFSITGWRLGYAVAPRAMAASLTLVHDLFYICAPTPLQHGVAAGFEAPAAFFRDMRAAYSAKRRLLLEALDSAGLTPIVPEGAYYILADSSRLGLADPRAAAMTLLERTGVAAVPGDAFYSGEGGTDLLRFCFAKQDAELEEAARRLRTL